MMEDLEGLYPKELAEELSQSFEFSDMHKQYLSELVHPEEWQTMQESVKCQTIENVFERLEELGIEKAADQVDAIKASFSSEISDELIDFGVRTGIIIGGEYIGLDPMTSNVIADQVLEFYYDKEGTEIQSGKSLSSDSIINIEAPNDLEQIDNISDILSSCSEIKFENWRNLDISEKVDVLNELESQIAEIECRPACPVSSVPMPFSQFGGYSPTTKSIELNESYLVLSGKDPAMLAETLDTIIHEGRHAYQDFNVNVCETHSRHSEVESWAETMEGGKWGYWGDCSDLLGQRLYEQQSIEIDARNFAADVLNAMHDKINA